MDKTVIIVGGGIAAFSCLEALIQEFCPKNPRYQCITVISASRLLKRAVNYSVRGRNIESFDVAEIDPQYITDLGIPDGLEVDFVTGYAKRVDIANKKVTVNHDARRLDVEYHFDILSICIGSSPNELLVDGSSDVLVKERLITIRDTTSVELLKSRLSSCRRIAIIGNGGIGLELVNRISNCEVIWIVRDEFIGHPFLDSEASNFIINSFAKANQRDDLLERPQYKSSSSSEIKTHGPALGPHWLQQRDLRGVIQHKKDSDIIFSCKVERIIGSVDHEWPITLILSDGREIQCDLVVSAIGVSPNTIDTFGGDIKTSKLDGGLLIDEQMRTSLSDIYAAGDVVSCDSWSSNPLWFQMRLWTQARQMGYYCGRCIAAHLEGTDASIYFNFDCFTHSTKFFGKKLILLGRFNLQKECQTELKDIEILIRVKRGQDYVKLVIKENRIIGAILVGDSGLEETIENLIHDQLDIGSIKHQLLDETVDIDDYFD